MARERYLVGVDPEELKYTPPPPPPSTPKGKWENYWYHYKWVTIIASFIAVALIIVIVQAVTKVKPDYTICLVTEQELSLQATQKLKAEFAAVGKDRNGDGEIVVELQALNIAQTAGNATVTAARQTVMAHIVARDMYLFAFPPSYYHNTLEPLFEEGAHFFAPLSADIGTYWNWKDSPLLNDASMQAVEIWQAVPSELYFGVRDMAVSDKEKAEQQAYTELLQAFIAAHS